MKHCIEAGNLADIIADYIKKAAGNVRLTERALLTKLDGLFASVNTQSQVSPPGTSAVRAAYCTNEYCKIVT